MADTLKTPPGNDRFSTGGMKAHFILVIIFVIYVSDYTDRYVVSSLATYIKDDWKITDFEIGALMTVVLFTITAFSIPASILVDRWSRRKMISIMVAFWSLATLACAFADSFWQLFIARAFIGIGEAGYAPAGTAMLAAAYPEESRGRAMGIWNIAIPLGMGLGMIGGGLIARHYHWQDAFGLVAVPGFFLAIIAWFMPDYKSVKVETPESAIRHGSNFVENYRSLFRIPSLSFTYLGFAMNVSCTTAIAWWLPTYFERIGLVEKGAGGSLATPILALVLVGAPLGGFITDHVRKRWISARLWIPALSSAIAGLLLLASCLNIYTPYQLPLLALYGIFITMFIAPAVSATQDLVHPALRALSYALCVIVQHILGDVWSPIVVGSLSDRFGLPVAMNFIALYCLLAALFFYIGSKFYERDLSRVEKVDLLEERKID
jgi:MFS family permease